MKILFAIDRERLDRRGETVGGRRRTVRVPPGPTVRNKQHWAGEVDLRQSRGRLTPEDHFWRNTENS